MEKRKMTNSPEKVYQSARYAIIFLVALTAVNILMSALDVNRYFVASVFMSYFMVSIMENTALGVAVAAAILVPYILAYFLSKKKPVWMVIALVLFVLDTLFVIFCMFLLHRAGNSPWSMLFDLALHAFVIFELAMGVKYREAATAEPDETAEGPAMPADEDGAYNEVSCAVAVSKENGKHTAEAVGVVRFYENEVVIGTVGTGMAVLIGAGYAAPTERLRFGYPEIQRVYYAKKNERTVRIDLTEDRYVYCAVNDATRDQLATQLYRHGFTIEPFAG